MKRRDILKLIGAAPLAAFPLPAIARVPELPPAAGITDEAMRLFVQTNELIQAIATPI